MKMEGKSSEIGWIRHRQKWEKKMSAMITGYEDCFSRRGRQESWVKRRKSQRRAVETSRDIWVTFDDTSI